MRKQFVLYYKVSQLTDGCFFFYYLKLHVRMDNESRISSSSYIYIQSKEKLLVSVCHNRYPRSIFMRHLVLSRVVHV